MKKNYRKIFSKNLREFMKIQHCKQNQLAKAVGISPSSICRYVNGEELPRIDIAYKLSIVLCFDLDKILEE